MIRSECSKKDCFFRVGNMCCNLCAPGNDSCSLYWVADSGKKGDAADAPDQDSKDHRQHMADGGFASTL